MMHDNEHNEHDDHYCAACDHNDNGGTVYDDHVCAACDHDRPAYHKRAAEYLSSATAPAADCG